MLEKFSKYINPVHKQYVTYYHHSTRQNTKFTLHYDGKMNVLNCLDMEKRVNYDLNNWKVNTENSNCTKIEYQEALQKAVEFLQASHG